MKGIIYRITTACLLVGWMFIIFFFSSQPANTSEKMSGGVCVELVTSVNEKMELELAEDAIINIAEQIEYPVRKLAHMTEYAVLSVLAFLFFYGYKNLPYIAAGKKRVYGIAFLLVVCYAATDEFHQLFVAGRAGRISDVLIDAIGAVFGLLFILLIRRILAGKRGK